MAGGVITEWWDSHFVFYIYGVMGLTIFISGCVMSSSIEADQIGVINLGLCERIKTNFSEIKTGFRVKELWRSFIFFFLLGCIVPTFQDFFYYFQLEVVGFTKLTYALIGSLGFFYLVIALQFYNAYLKDRETWIMMVIACFTNLLGSIGCILFVR